MLSLHVEIMYVLALHLLNQTHTISYGNRRVFIFLNVQSPLTSAQGNGPTVWERTSLIWRWRLSATRTMWANIFLPACRMTLFQLLAEIFFRISENDLEQQPLLRHGTGHFVFCLRGIQVRPVWSHLNSSYASMTFFWPSRICLATSGRARAPVKMPTKSL